VLLQLLPPHLQLILLNSTLHMCDTRKDVHGLLATIQRLYKMTLKAFAFLLAVVLTIFGVKKISYLN